MISLVLAMLAAPVQPAVAVAHSNLAAVPLQTRRQRMDVDGRRLLDRAQKLRATYRPAPGQPTTAELDAAIDQMKSDLDSMSEMGETESLRLQMAMDRMSKLMSTLSNLLKKAGDTDQSIIQNMK